MMLGNRYVHVTAMLMLATFLEEMKLFTEFSSSGTRSGYAQDKAVSTILTECVCLQKKCKHLPSQAISHPLLSERGLDKLNLSYMSHFALYRVSSHIPSHPHTYLIHSHSHTYLTHTSHTLTLTHTSHTITYPHTHTSHPLHSLTHTSIMAFAAITQSSRYFLYVHFFHSPSLFTASATCSPYPVTIRSNISRTVSAGSAPSPDSLYRILTAQSGLSVHHSECNLTEMCACGGGYQDLVDAGRSL